MLAGRTCALVLWLVFAPTALAQSYSPPRAADGRPDLQGFWISAWITPLERTTEAKTLVLAPPEAKALYSAVWKRMDDVDPLGPYDSWDVGSLAIVRGETRSSLVIDPADGRVPFTEEGLKRRAQLPPPAGLDGPEQRPRVERCMMNVNSLPPFLSTPAGNIRQIVQAPGSVLFHTESFSQLRVVPMGQGPARPGASIARWEGDTLVIETAFAETDRFRTTRLAMMLFTTKTRMTERFTRIADDEIVYRFTLEDPLLYTRPWTAETSLRKTGSRIYEWSCHEANYGLAGILSGARAVERRAAGRAGKARP